MAIVGIGGWMVLIGAGVAAVVLAGFALAAVRISGLHSEIEREAERREQAGRLAESVGRGVAAERERQLREALRKLWRA